MSRIIGPTNAAEQFRDWEKRLRAVEGGLGALARDKVYPSTQRPDPTGRAGARIFDYDQGRPLWSNGTIWVDAMGVDADLVAVQLSGSGSLGSS